MDKQLWWKEDRVTSLA